MGILNGKTLAASGVISLLSIYHYNITKLSVISSGGFIFEISLILLFLIGVEFGKGMNNNINKNEEDAEE